MRDCEFLKLTVYQKLQHITKNRMDIKASSSPYKKLYCYLVYVFIAETWWWMLNGKAATIFIGQKIEWLMCGHKL